jgi:hypothetical protein
MVEVRTRNSSTGSDRNLLDVMRRGPSLVADRGGRLWSYGIGDRPARHRQWRLFRRASGTLNIKPRAYLARKRTHKYRAKHEICGCLVTPHSGGPGTRPGGITTPLRGARWTGPSWACLGPERFQVMSLGAEEPRSEETWTWKRGPGIRNRRGGAPRGASPLRKRRGHASPGVSGGLAGRSGSLARSRVSRRSAPLIGSDG